MTTWREDQEEELRVDIEGEELAEEKTEKKRVPRPLISAEMDDDSEPVMKKIAYLAFLYGTHPDHQKNGSERGVDERRKGSFESWWRAYTRGLR